MAAIPKQRTVDALRAVWTSLDELLSSLDDEQWSLPTCLPGWDVQANVAHVIGTEQFLLGRQPDRTVDADDVAHVRNPIGELNESWIVTYADRTPAEVLAAFRGITAERLQLLEAMSPTAWDEAVPTPAGKDSYGRFMRIRVFDCWMHEQDIRSAVGVPGHDSGLAVEVTLDEMAAAMGFVVGKKAAAPDGASVTFDLTGPADRHIHVLVDGRASVVPELEGLATVTLTMPIIAFSRIAGGRADAAPDSVLITGDTDLGRRILEQLAYTI